MIEEMYKEETKIQDDQNPESNYQIHAVDQKPIHGYYSSTANVSIGAHNAAAGAGKVSLTLGLQQNGHDPTSIAVMQSPHRESLLLSRDDNFDEGQDGHFAILGDVDGLPYRNLTDADQLLHDLA